MPTPVQNRGMPTCTSIANASIASTSSATAQPRAGSSARAVAAEERCSTAPTTPATPTPAVKNSKISRRRPMSEATGTPSAGWPPCASSGRAGRASENRTRVACSSAPPSSLTPSVTVSSSVHAVDARRRPSPAPCCGWWARPRRGCRAAARPACGRPGSDSEPFAQALGGGAEVDLDPVERTASPV